MRSLNHSFTHHALTIDQIDQQHCNYFQSLSQNLRKDRLTDPISKALLLPVTELLPKSNKGRF
jgi:hypothetical protein